MTGTAIITGGSGGMGVETAKILGKDHHILLADVNETRLEAVVEDLRSQGISAEATVCDIADRDSVDALMARGNRNGDLRCVVHTAGISPSMGSAGQITQINGLGTINVTEAALEVASPGFALVSVASVAGHLLPSRTQPKRTFALALTDPEKFTRRLTRIARSIALRGNSGTAYALSKAFVIWYCEAMAARFGAVGARILSVSPGAFNTQMGRLEKENGSESLAERSALQRVGRPEEVAELLAFCASDKPGYLTGTDILCDGGGQAVRAVKEPLSLGK